MGGKYSVFDVANWFLRKSGGVTPKKLQKLCYYAQAWSNALLDGDMMNDTNFEAWAHGPVSPVLYPEYKSYKWNEIPAPDKDIVQFDEKTNDLLESVWLTYGDKSANELEALTHTELPWTSARKRAGATEGSSCNETIAAEDMKSYYTSIYAGD